MTREETVVEAVKQAKLSQFGLTAIKIEFEAKFNRRNTPRGNACEECNGTGRWSCDACEGRGNYPCEDCDGSGCAFCTDGHYSCDDCDGAGTEDCATCGGVVATEPNAPNWNDMSMIHDKVLAKLVKHGLARKLRVGETSNRSHKYTPISPLVYSKVYVDGTVDTEWTLTLLMDNPDNVLLLPKLSKVFSDLKDEIGQGIDVSNAGMHISLLNSPEGKYPVSVNGININRFNNFRRSMILLLPALYFLGSSNAKSRILNYRTPTIGSDVVSGAGKYSAISYRGGGLEFRLFETCYDTPEVILDNIVVMVNCLRFWTRAYTRNYLAKVANNVDFGIDQGSELKRLFVTTEHIDLLNRGLRMVKPSYLSITEMKKQRGFTTTKTDVKDRLKNAREKAEAEYKVYENRYSWERTMQKNNYINRFVQDEILRHNSADFVAEGEATAPPDEAKLKEFADKAEEQLKRDDSRKIDVTKYCERHLPRIAKVGEFKLCAE